MFRFEHPEHIKLLLVLPLLMLLYGVSWYMRRKAIEQLGTPDLIARLMPDFSANRQHLKMGILLLCITFLAIAWANPQWGTKREKVQRKSADVFIALDISNSMMAQDVAPTRLDRARQFCQRLIRELKGERIGLIFFAGNAYLQMPLSTDYAAAELFLRAANPSQASTQGTAIGDAIDMALQSSDKKAQNQRALIIVTDGEDHDSDAKTKAKEAASANMLINTVGVGTSQGAPIPDASGTGQYKTDANGQVILSKINEEMLAEFAKIGGGNYYSLAAGDQIVQSIRSQVDKLEKQELEQRSFTEHESYFQYFLLPALLLLLLEFVLPLRHTKKA
jgi:Ca-activated chloride channel family protein